MNPYFIIILTTLLAGYLLDLAATLLNLRTLTAPLPAEFAGMFGEEAYAKSQEYTRTRSRFGLLETTIDLAAVLAFWFSGSFNAVDRFARHFAMNEILTGLVYVGVLIVLRSLLSLPFSVYSTFFIEERVGFNKTTPKTFITDILKGIALGLVLGVPILAGIIWFFLYAGPLAWFYCWIVATVFSLIVQYIAPRWIMPLFNKFTPLEEGELRKAILDYARSVRFSVRDIFVMDGSKRSGKSNAFFTGFGRNKRIALFDTLIAKHTTNELVAVLAHEIGHYKKRHIVQGMVIGTVQAGVLLYLLSIFLHHEGLFRAFFMEHASVYAGLLFFSMLYAPIEMILSIALHGLSRKNEFEADRFSAETCVRDGAMIDALKKLSVDNLSHLTPHPFFVWLNYSHPPVLERIRAIRSLQQSHAGHAPQT